MEQTRSLPSKFTNYNVFKNSILKFIRPSPNKIFQCYNPKIIKLVTRLSLGLNHLQEHKFKHSFQDILNPLCSCGVDIETTSHYFLHCPSFHAERSSLLSNINRIDSTIFNKSDSVVTRILLYGNESFKDEVNLLTLNATEKRTNMVRDHRQVTFVTLNRFCPLSNSLSHPSPPTFTPTVAEGKYQGGLNTNQD